MYDVVFFPLWCFTCCDKNHALTLVYTYSTPALRTTKMFGLFLRLTLGFLSHFSFLSVFCIKIAPTHVTCLIIYVTWLRSFFLPFPLTFSVALLVVFDMRILSKYLLPVLLSCVSALTVSSFCDFYDFFLSSRAKLRHQAANLSKYIHWIPFWTHFSCSSSVFFKTKSAPWLFSWLERGVWF